MLKRGLILLLAILLLGLPLASAPAGASGCCGSASEGGGKAGGANEGSQANNPDNSDRVHKTASAHKNCCCGDPKACTCHLTKDETTPSPDAVPVSTNTDQRPCVTEVHAAPLESILPHCSPVTPLVRFTFARAPSSDIYVLNHNFLC